MEPSENVSAPPGESGPHFVYRWRGSAYEIGRQHGEALRSEIIAEFAPTLRALANATAWSEARILSRHSGQYEAVFQELVPRAMEELQGLAAGAGLSFEEAFFAATRDGANIPRDEGCTAFFAGSETTADGRVLMGQTKDTSSPLERYRVMEREYDDGLKTLSLNYPGWMAQIGLSSHGLGNTGNALFATRPAGDSMPYSLLKRLVLEKESVADVMKAIAGYSFETGSALLGSSSGEGVALEFAAGKMGAEDVSRRAYGHANSVLAPELKCFAFDLSRGDSDALSSDSRQANVQRWLNDNCGHIDVDGLKTLVAGHESFPHSICRHGGPLESRTTAAVVMDLTQRSLHVAIGNPCTAPFREYRLAL